MTARALRSIPVSLIVFAERCCNFFFNLSALFCSLLVLLIFFQVLARYLFSISFVGLQELQWHLFGFMIMLSIATTLKRDQHVKVDIFYSKFTPKNRAIVDQVSYICGLLISMVLIYFGWRFAATALVFQSPIALDHFSRSWFVQDGVLFQIASFIEGLLRSTFLIGEISADPGGLEARWIIKGAIPLGGTLLFFQNLALIFRTAQSRFRGDR